jgi:hypothetical protein
VVRNRSETAIHPWIARQAVFQQPAILAAGGTDCTVTANRFEANAVTSDLDMTDGARCAVSDNQRVPPAAGEGAAK